MPTRVLIVDDHQVFADALAVRLGAEPDLRVVATATNGDAAVAMVGRHRPDLAVIDIDLGEDNGLEVFAELRAEHPAIVGVVVTGDSRWQTVAEAVRAGAAGLVTKGAPIDELLRAVRGATAGESRFPPRLLTQALRHLVETETERSEGANLLAGLTKREHDVLEQMVAGLDRNGIAQRLFLSANTVRTHAKNIYAKLGVHSGLEAVNVALKAGMRPPADTAV